MILRVGLPDLEAREAALRVHTRGMALEADAAADAAMRQLAARSEGAGARNTARLRLTCGTVQIPFTLHDSFNAPF